MNLLKNLVLTVIPDRYAATSYSQQGEDLAIQRYFNKENGFYVDIGAYHPVIFSNTYLFYKKGWSGVNIEPNPDNFGLFQNHRRKDINLNIAINSAHEKLTYYRFNAATLNTFDKDEANKMNNHNGYLLTESLEVQTYTLSEVLGKCLKKGQKIDFMSIDVEGLELNVLQSNDWVLFKPEMLLVEERATYEHKSFDESRIYTFLKDLGYELWCITGITMIFILKH